MTIPKHVGQVPLFYNHKPSARGAYYKTYGSADEPGRSYTLLDPYPSFPFGYGLSYTEFAYSHLRTEVLSDGCISVSVVVQNTGARAGKEVVQVYINDEISSVTTPVKALKGFKKINLEPGETKTVEFVLGFDELYLIDENLNKTVEEGWFEVTVADQTDRFYLSAEQCEAINIR